MLMKPLMILIALLATETRVVVNEPFDSPDAIKRWRLGAGSWTVVDGSLRGAETPERKHAAGLAHPLAYHDAEIKFRFLFDGGNTAMLLLRNRFGNLCRVTITRTSVTLTKDKPNLPAGNQETTVVLAKSAAKFEPGRWYSVRAEVRGDQLSAEIEGVSPLSGGHPAIDVDKTEVEFLAGGVAMLFDDLIVTELK